MWPEKTVFKTKSAEARFERLKKLVEAMDVLPTTARVPMRILELHRSRSSTLDQYGDALMADASLASRVLSLANSAWAGQNKQVTKISEAMRLIGVNNLMPLLFGVSLAGVFNHADIPPSQREALWKSSLMRAVIARHFANIDQKDLTEQAFLCALMQDIGLPAMLSCDQAAAAELMLVVDLDPAAAATRERGLYGVTHGEVAAVISKRLKLPELFVKTTESHHMLDGPKLPAEFAHIGPALRMSATIPHVASGDMPGIGERFAKQLLIERPNTTPVNVKQLVVTLIKEYNQLLGILGGKDAADALRFRSFLQDVCDQVARTLSSAIDESVREVNRLESRVGELETKAAGADIDSLTGLVNRRAFTARGTELMRLAAEIHSFVGIGFADIDDFKLVNDQNGHEAGDAALRALGGALKQTVGKRGVAGRFGGDEFVFLLLAENAQQQEQMTQSLQKVLCKQECKIGEKRFPVSFSVGIQWLGTPDANANFEAELKRVDELMYKAKQAGKNRCIIQPAPQRAAA